MRKALGLLALLAVVGSLVWFLTRGSPPAPEPAAPNAAPQPVAPSGRSTDLAGQEKTVESPARAAITPEATPPTTVQNTAATTQAPAKAEIRGRFLLPGGAPASAVVLSVHGWGSNNEQLMKYGQPEHWTDPSGTTREDGRFSIVFDPPRAYQFVLEATSSNYCKTSWRWPEILAGSVVDVGDVELVRGGSIRGRIVDAKGRALTKDWMVYADASVAGGRASGRDATRVMAQPNSRSGEFLLDGLPPGRVRLKAHSQIANWIEGPAIEVRTGEETKADIPYNGPDNEARIVVIPFCRPFYIFEGDPAEVLLSATGFETRKAAKIEHSSQSFSFDDVPPGSYTVEIKDARFQPWSKSGVEPGSSVNAHLKGSAAVSLTVVDDASNEPVKRYTLDVRFDQPNRYPNSFRILEPKDEPPAGGLFDGMIPHDQTFIVRADGYAPLEVPAPGLGAGETRALVARLGHGLRIAGRVVAGEAKKPFAGATVTLAPTSGDGRSQTVMRGGGDIDSRSCVSGADGGFAFEGVSPRAYSLSASSGAFLASEEQITLPQGQPLEAVEIALPAPAFLAGRLIGPEGASFDGLRLVVLPVSADTKERARLQLLSFSREIVADSVAQDGSFRIGPLPAGDATVSLGLPQVVIPNEMGWSSGEGNRHELETVSLLPDVDTRKDFDIRDVFPGSIRVRVRVNGVPAPALLVKIEEAEHGKTAAAVQLDAHGEGKSGPLLPGTYRFDANAIDGSWVHTVSETRALKAGESATIDIEVALFEGKLLVIDASTGKPLADADVHLTLEGPRFGQSARAHTDAQGVAKIALPTARYRVETGYRFGPGATESAAVIEWTAAGPVPAEVRVEPAISQH